MDYGLFNKYINNEDYSPSSAYLLEKVSNDCGFFGFDKKLCFVVKNGAGNNKAISTKYVEFIPNMELNAIANDPSFMRGSYDFLILKEQQDNNVIDSFIELCELYGNNPVMSFDDFISSVVDLFQLSRKQSYLDCIGFIGELIVLYIFYNNKVDLSNYWHLSGPFSKYDFSLPSMNIEVKSSTTDSTTFRLKHSQLFNNENNYVALVSLRKTDSSGFSIHQLTRFFKGTTPFSKNLRFLIALEKELQKQIDPEMFDSKFELVSLFFFDSKEMQTFKEIPFNISDLSYNYDFDLSESIDLEEFVNNYLTKAVE